MPRILISVYLRLSRYMGIQIFNSNAEAKIIGQKVALAGVLMYPGNKVEWNKTKTEEKPMEVNGIGMEEWEGKFLSLFE